MGTGKKEANRKIRQGKVGDGMANVKTKGENFYRNAKKVKQLNILRTPNAKHNAAGDIVQSAKFQSRQVPTARVEPNRKVCAALHAALVVITDLISGSRTPVSSAKMHLIRSEKLWQSEPLIRTPSFLNLTSYQ